MSEKNLAIDFSVAALQSIEENKYWGIKLSGELSKSNFPHDIKYDIKTGQRELGAPDLDGLPLELSCEVSGKLLKLANNSDYRLHMIFTAVVVMLLERYTGNNDIIIGTPVYKQETGENFVNTVLALRNPVEPGLTFKELLLRVKNTIMEAVKNQNFPIQALLYKLGIPYPGDRETFPLFDVAVLLENIHDRNYLRHINLNIIFSLLKNGSSITGVIYYNRALYKKNSIARIAAHFTRLAAQVPTMIDAALGAFEMLSDEEKKQLLVDFNDTQTPYPGYKTIRQWFEEQVEKAPDHIALTGYSVSGPRFNHRLSYRELNERANELAYLLWEKGAGPHTITAIMAERTVEMITGIMGILKSGGVYLPVDPEYPESRIYYMLENCNVSFLLAGGHMIAERSFSELSGLLVRNTAPVVPISRLPIGDLDWLPFPDRSLIDYEKYSNNISLAMVKHSISLQGTRGCPYNCAYCAKLWPKKHVVRSAEHIFAEVLQYYKIGIRRFSFIDDIFNLDIENSRRFFQMVMDNGLKIQIFFPAGLRGDIMTHDYIDLMVKAGTVNISVALETASPRLQKLIGKHLNIEKLRENLEYICLKHPGVILDLFTMHGLPTETEAEAMMTLDFIKSLKWLHFPLINILKIYPGTDMEKLALESGISREAILKAENLPWHEFSETLPFSKNFTMKYQADFLNDYFLLKERLLQVLPNQMKSLTRDEIVQKYKSYLPVEIHTFADLLRVVGLSENQLNSADCVAENYFKVESLNEKLRNIFPGTRPAPGALRILLLDLSQSFSADNRLLDELFEPPLGLMYLLTTLNREFGDKITGKIAKSGIDFDNYSQLKELLKEFRPDLIGIRTLTFYKDFFHRTISLIRQWGIHVPVISGGPYATNGYKALLQDPNVDLVVLAEGEMTFLELVSRILENNKQWPPGDVLKNLPGIAFVPGKRDPAAPRGYPNNNYPNDSYPFARQIIDLDQVRSRITPIPAGNIGAAGNPHDPAYIIFTSGSTGKPKGVVIEHKSVVNLVTALNERVYKQYPGRLKVGLLAPFVFDASVKQIFAALLLGHNLCLIPEETRLDGVGLLAYYKREGIDVSDGTPAYIHLLSESMGNDNWGKSGVKHFLIGGEQLAMPVVVRLFKQCGFLAPKITNVYGPTECCVDAAAFEITINNVAGQETFPIGAPLANVRIYILGKGSRLQPLGVAGELCIGGVGVGRGYINDILLTVQKFVPNPFVENDRVYLTGDLARWLTDGNIEYIGRIDHQVKIRGYRIELEEIESLVLRYPGIKEAVVTTISKSIDNTVNNIDNSDNSGDVYICAYFVAAGEIDPNGLKKYLSRQLPGYMMPWKYIALEKIPLTPNGKVDKKSLPLPEDEENPASEYMAPTTKTQEKLVSLWSEILGVEKARIGIDADFFDLGGHSLKAVILLSRIHKEFGVKISLVDIFSAPVIRKLSTCIDSSLKEIFVPIEPVEEREYYEMSPAQKRMYVLQAMTTTATSYNKPYLLLLRGTMDKQNLEAAFKKLIDRHLIFRTSFEGVAGRPVQRIHAHVHFAIEYMDIAHIQVEHHDHAIKNLIEAFIRPFELSVPPLMRVGLVKKNGQEHLLMVDIHHITSDGMAMGILVKEFMMILGGESLPPLKIQYKDYAHWQNSEWNREILERQKEYWLEILSGDIPVLNLQPDFARPTVQSFAGNRVGFEFSGDETRRLNDIVREIEGTIYTLMLTVFYVCLSKLTGQEDIIIGTPVMGRRHADLENIIGMFVNTLAMRNYPCGNKSFRAFAWEVKRRTLEAFDNQDYQFENLLDDLDIIRDISRNPLFDVLFALQKFDIPHLEMKDLTIEPYDYENTTSKFDLNWMGTEMGGRLVFTVEYCTKLFTKETIERFIAYFKRIACDLIENPARLINEIEIISLEEKKQVLYEFNDTAVDYPSGKTIQQLFTEQVERNPDRIALVGADEGEEKKRRREEEKNGGGETLRATSLQIQITYRQLHEQSNRLAGFLVEKGVLADDIVALKMPRSTGMVIAILATLKAGCAYMPIDPDYPQERIDYMLKDSAAKILLTAAEGISNFHHSSFIVHHSGHPGQLAYIMYTSGSTGKPKGVMVGHRSVIRLVINNDFIEFSDRLRVLQTGAPVFDAVTFEMWGPLLNGGQLYLVDNEVILDPVKLSKALQKYLINTMWLTSSLFNQLAHQDSDIFSLLKWLVVGGDVLSPRYIAEVRRKNNHLTVVNGYGPTENTTFSVCQRIDRDYDHNIPIGKPIANSCAYIIDKYNRLQPVGIAGELYVGGDGLARGYLNNPELTADKFNKDLWDYQDNQDEKNKSFAGVKGGLFQKPPLVAYKTGDLARWLPGGVIEFLGRVDYQVKIRGFRVELGEIEKRLAGFEEIGEVVVMVGHPERESGDKILCAYFTAQKEIDVNALRKKLEQQLPGYMIPAHFMRLEKMPLTRNGKIDRRALPLLELKADDKYVAPGDETEAQIAEIWSRVLDIKKEIIGVHDDFFHLGGHSLKAMLLAVQAAKVFNVKFSLTDVFTGPTIREMADVVRQGRQNFYEEIKPVEKREYYLQSSAQKRLFFLEQFENIGTTYNISSYLKIEGELDIQRFHQAIRKIIQRHETLRTSFKIIANEPVQIVHDHVDFEIENYTGVSITDGIRDFVRPFDLSRAPLFRIGLITLPGEGYLLLYDLHHIIGDGTSMGILVDNFATFYEGKALPSLHVQYKDFTAWQNDMIRAHEIEKQEKYWLSVFAKEIPVLRFPTDYPRPENLIFKGDRCFFNLEGEAAQAIHSLAFENKATLFMVMLAAFNVLLYRYSGQSDIIVGTGIMGRHHADLQRSIGMFVNSLAIRNYPTGEKTFFKFLNEVRENCIGAFANQDVQFEELVDKLKLQRDNSRNPLFDVLLVVQNFEQAKFDDLGDLGGSELKEVKISPYYHENKTSKFDLNLAVWESGPGIYFRLEYATALFKPETIAEIIDNYIGILKQMIAGKDILLDEFSITNDLLEVMPDISRIDKTEFTF